MQPKQQSSKATKQQSSKAARQPGSKAAGIQDVASDFLFIFLQRPQLGAAMVHRLSELELPPPRILQISLN